MTDDLDPHLLVVPMDGGVGRSPPELSFWFFANAHPILRIPCPSRHMATRSLFLISLPHIEWHMRPGCVPSTSYIDHVDSS